MEQNFKPKSLDCLYDSIGIMNTVGSHYQWGIVEVCGSAELLSFILLKNHTKVS